MVSLLIFSLVLTSNIAYSAEGKKKNKCKAIGISDVKQYVLKKNRTCLKNQNAAESKGFTPLVMNLSNTPQRRRPKCAFVGFKGFGFSLTSANLTCFKNERAATKKGYTPFAGFGVNAAGTPSQNPPAGPTPTLSPDGTPNLDPTPTSVPTLAPATESPDPNAPNFYQFNLVNPANGIDPRGACSASINTSQLLAIQCSHDVTNPTEAHLHIPGEPDAFKFCVLRPVPLSNFLMNCFPTAEQIQEIINGNAFLSIHSAPGGSGQEAIGYIAGNNENL